MGQAITEYIEDALHAESLESLKALTASTLERYGFNKFSYLGLNPHPTAFREKFPTAFYQSAFVQSTYPKRWVEFYEQNFFFYLDPILGTAKSSFLPFWWDAKLSAKSLSRAEKKVMNRAGEFGIKRGVVVPIHAPAGEFAALALTTDVSVDELENIWEENRHELLLVGTYYHAAIWERFFERKIEPTPRLSPRELQCLQWTAKGKTIWEVAQILGLSESTTKFYLKSAMHKLDTSNKTHAVSKALVHGLITI